ncbi:MAG: SET domain-containing protein [Ferruginibacter sp.]
MLQPNLVIREIPGKGRGVFTEEAIAKETIIEIAPVIVMPKSDRVHLDQTLLHDYIFEWGPQLDQCVMALGWIPIYNHSYASNCEYFMDFDNNTMWVKTVRAIEAGEEITINYNGDWNDSKKVWFDVLEQ